jgi:hypothetical protein
LGIVDVVLNGLTIAILLYFSAVTVLFVVFVSKQLINKRRGRRASLRQSLRPAAGSPETTLGGTSAVREFTPTTKLARSSQEDNTGLLIFGAAVVAAGVWALTRLVRRIDIASARDALEGRAPDITSGSRAGPSIAANTGADSSSPARRSEALSSSASRLEDTPQIQQESPQHPRSAPDDRYKEVEQLLEEFRDMAKARLSRLHMSPPEWKYVWAKSAQVGEAFKGVGFPTPAARQKAWDSYLEIQREITTHVDEDSRKRINTSAEYRQRILRVVSEAEPDASVRFSSDARSELKRLGEKLEEARELLRQHRDAIVSMDKYECSRRIEHVEGVHRSYWDQLKKDQARERAARKKNQARERAAKTDAYLQRRRKRHQEKSVRLHQLLAEAEDRRAKIRDAWNESWASAAQKGLSKVEDRIQRLEEEIKEIEADIAHAERSH